MDLEFYQTAPDCLTSLIVYHDVSAWYRFICPKPSRLIPHQVVRPISQEIKWLISWNRSFHCASKRRRICLITDAVRCLLFINKVFSLPSQKERCSTMAPNTAFSLNWKAKLFIGPVSPWHSVFKSSYSLSSSLSRPCLSIWAYFKSRSSCCLRSISS